MAVAWGRTVAGDKDYDTKDLLADCGEMGWSGLPVRVTFEASPQSDVANLPTSTETPPALS